MSNIAIAKWLKLISKKYKYASRVLQYAEEKHVSILKAQHHLKLKFPEPLTHLLETAVYHMDEIEYLLDKFDIVDHLNHINKYVLKVLVTELLWVKQYLSPNSCTRILYYEADLLESFTEAAKTFNKLEDSTVPILPVYVRINTLAIQLQDGINAFLNDGWKLLPKCKTHADYMKIVSNLKDNNFVRDFHISELLVFPSDTLFYSHPGYISGKFFIQDKGSCLSSFLLNPKPGSRILDMCAAPGLKTNHLANIINNEGIIFACDNHPDRYNALCKLVESTKVTCVETIYDDCMKINQNGINYILVDVPSTYSGIFYKRERKVYLEKKLERSFKVASMILRYALQNFKGVKRVVYTSCSKFPEETDNVIDDALREIRGAYSLLDTKEMLWNQWGNGGDSTHHPRRSKNLHIKPKVDLCEGYFIAVFERNPEVPIPRYVNRKEELFYEDEEDESDHDIDNEDDEDFTEKNRHKDNGSKKSFPNHDIKDYKPQHYKPYNKHLKNDKNDKYSTAKIKAPKPRASSSTSYSRYNDYDDFLHETTHSQLYP
ncbi:28S rRNA (cytosine-C(5))-methyltransferase-like isoform X2 [Phymastichus coffea]|nr:28S rRNA (cytosine-C(5))-methyltransferase-like isoform X2 [Phymastichus coffea]